jgi:hypothetical protein
MNVTVMVSMSEVKVLGEDASFVVDDFEFVEFVFGCLPWSRGNRGFGAGSRGV